jgi:hypothetical protein
VIQGEEIKINFRGYVVKNVTSSILASILLKEIYLVLFSERIRLTGGFISLAYNEFSFPALFFVCVVEH